MIAYIQIVLWTVAFQGILMVSLSRAVDFVPNHLVAFAFAPCLGVLVATVRRLPSLQVVMLLVITYVLAILVRVGGQCTPWWDYDPGFFAAMFVVPLPIAGLIKSLQDERSK